MDKKDKENYLKAGKIASRLHKIEKAKIKPGQKLLEIAERIEKKTVELGGKPAFPVNLSINNNAAHYTPPLNDESVLGEKDVLKVDTGVHVEGCIADSAFTLDFSGEHGKMAEAAELGLESALSSVKVGMTLKDLGAKIEKAIKGKGFQPIQNLSGHGMDKWRTHIAPSIPNIENSDDREIEEEGVYAFEPFACNGKGIVREAPQTYIYELDELKPVRNLDARKIVEKAAEEYKTLPFAERWIQKGLSEFKFKVALRELLQKKVFQMHPILREEKGVTVTQAENTIIVDNGKIIRLLK